MSDNVDIITRERNHRIKAGDWIMRAIPDENVRKIIFGKDYLKRESFLSDQNAILGYTANILKLAYHHVYFRYRKKYVLNNGVLLGSAEEDESIRVFKVLKDMYLFNDLTVDIMNSVLTDVNIDIILKNGHIAESLSLENDFNKNPDLKNMFYIAKQFNNARSTIAEDAIERIDKFINSIRPFVFLRDLAIDYQKICNVKYISGDGTVLDARIESAVWKNINDFSGDESTSTYNCLIRLGGRNVYYLQNIECILSDGRLASFGEGDRISLLDDGGIRVMAVDNKKIVAIKLNYELFGDANSYLSLVIGDNPAELENYAGEKDGFFYLKQPYSIYFATNFLVDRLYADRGETVFEDFYSINYKYIRNLALAVVDIINNNDDLRQRLYNVFSKNFKSLFIKHANPKIMDWDVLISIMMIEDGAHKLLSTLFSNVDNSFEDLLKNLEVRFGRDVFDSATLKALETRQLKIAANNASGAIEFNEMNEIRSEIRARIVMAKVSRAIQGADVVSEQIGFPLSIRSRIQMLETILKDNTLENRQKIDATSIIVNQTLYTLIIFYRGFFRYMECEQSFENKSLYQVMTSAEIAAEQERAQRAFDAETEKYAFLLSDIKNNYAKLSKALTELCEECVTGTANNSLLKNGIGRQRLMDNKYLIKLLDGAMKYAEADDSSEEYAPQFIETVIAALRYLQTGETDPIKQRDQKLSLKAIFPYVATYQFAKQTGDGYLINNFSIISAGGVDQNVQVLSEFEYRLNEKYYCLPHRKRSSSELNLWVEPVMIHYRGKTEERTE